MTTTIASSLADIYLPTTLGDLLTVPAGETWVVTSVELGNINAAPQTVSLYWRIGATDGFEVRGILNQWWSLSGNGAVTLPPGAKLRGQTTTANAVRAIVSGYKVQP
jgi:hypothetical protein